MTATARKLRGAPELGPLEARDRLGVVGKTGRGKSNFVKQHLRRELDAGRRVVAFDYCDEYSAKGHATSEVTLGPLRDRLEWSAFIDNAAAALGDPNLSLAIIPSKDQRECGEQFSELVALVEAQGSLLLCADEIGMFGEHCVPAMHKLAAQSRHWDVPAIFASQSMIDIHARARRQLTALVCFQQTHPPDLQALRELTETSNPTFADDVPRLSPGEFRLWRDG